MVLDAPPTGRIAQFLGVNSELAGLAQVGPDQVAGRPGDEAVPLAADRHPPGHRAGGDAGAGDRRRDRRAARGGAPRRRRGRQHGAPAGPRRRPARGRPRGHPRRGGGSGTTSRRRGSTSTTTWSPGCWPRRTTTPYAGRWRTPSATVVAGLGVPVYELPRLTGGVDLGGLYELAADLKERGPGMSRPARRPAPRARFGPLAAPASAAPPLDVDALLDDRGHRDHRVLRLRRGRQDHDLGRARAARRRAGPAGGRADHRPGPPARPVDGHRAARQHPAAGPRRRRRRDRSTR